MQNILKQLNISNAFVNKKNEIEYLMWVIESECLGETSLTKKMYISFDGIWYTIREVWVHYTPVFDHITEVLDGYEGGLGLQDVKDIICWKTKTI